MNLVYYVNKRGNFGDDLNPVFFDSLCPDYRAIRKDVLYGIGTLLNESKGLISNSIIFGSGYGQGRAPQVDARSTINLGVRGPITASVLGLEAASVMGDPALFLPKMDCFDQGVSESKHKVVLALHHKTAEFWDFSKASIRNAHFLDPACSSVFDYVATIRSADLVLAESMHAAIVAAAYRVPFIRVGILNKVDNTKWKDFFLSVGLTADSSAIPLHKPKLSVKRFVELGLVGRKIIPHDYAYSKYAGPSDADLEAIDDAVNKVVSSIKPLLPVNSHLEEKQERCERAIYLLNEMARTTESLC